MSRTNICRNLHRLLHASGAQFPVALTMVPVTIRLRKPRPHNEVVEWPMIRISDWARAILSKNPSYLLGGFSLEDADGWQHQFATFWSCYESIDPTHEVFRTGLDLGRVIPFAHHGDEGRGLRAKPYLVESFQPIIGRNGMFSTHESGYLNCKSIILRSIKMGMLIFRVHGDLLQEAFLHNKILDELHLIPSLCWQPDSTRLAYCICGRCSQCFLLRGRGRWPALVD